MNNVLDSGETKNILVVDDTLDNLIFLSAILESKGYCVYTANDGKSAISLAMNYPLDLILLDIIMSDMNGYEVCKQLKSCKQTSKIPIIFMSGLSHVDDKVKAFKMGGVDFISKPFQYQEVMVRVEHHLELNQIQKQLINLNLQLEERVQERTLQLEQANEQLLKIVLHDSLTGLLNRRAFIQQLKQAFQQNQTHLDQPYAILFLDCDRFKFVNDSLGHFAGDELLIAIAQRLQSFLDPPDLIARLGGDEFVILLNPLRHRDPQHIANQILESFSHPFRLGIRTVFINFSIGLAISNPSYQKPEDLLRDADTALYQAKALGKGRYQLFEPEMYQAVLQRLQLETDLRKALVNQEFSVHYQPIISLNSGIIIGFEALIRWHHPTQGLIPPGLFIPIAEETGLIARIGEWVLRESCHQVSAWKKQRLSDYPLTVSVNLSALQFSQENLIKQIDNILDESQLEPQYLNLEITESAILDHPETASDILKQFKKRRINLSIDDFGTGYSSLSYLHSFPVDTLKIDRSFITPIDDNPNTLGLVPVIISLVQTLGMNVIAEGIETAQQLDQLRKLNCNAGQGYLFSKPVNSQTATHLIQSSPHW
ncbi:putative diguanylate cyclase/phosphodiesterase (GGDEF & EAL domains) with Response Regulator Receiver modulation [Planktothrix serta PCC 8927]|uniref:Diguanylate cyclase/phosphodiesterase (GGDEF & EAL domains) with Response Regulator Receiver modulation n=1 Tax=Planktothrix serta PCC 8927 TaxID=671068 RepID=A0A7Z9BSD7_9CYAN|nr:EAL domain-containing protein [Planktothrix serta]VXD21871.1 putative diguanylate cyclase/phosphodiesterase (GGDEF & EAL domains) with Response Regulator Receiver modulation [Planktothrix serta PCC 8927]